MRGKPLALQSGSIRPLGLRPLVGHLANLSARFKHYLPTPMSRFSFSHLACAALLFLGCISSAMADEYSDVNRMLRAGQLAEAAAKADQFLSSKPRDPQMRFLKGVVLSEQSKTAEAITTFTKLTEDFPELPEPYNNLAVLYAGQSQFDKARAALEMAIRTNPSYATAHENLGDVYAKLASQAYSKALQLDGGNTAVQPKLALIRDLFAPGAKPGAKPAATPPAAPAPAPVAKAPTPVATPAAAPAVVAAAPAAAAPVAKPVAPTTAGGNADVEAAVRAWASAWSAREVKDYLAAYGRDFTPEKGQGRKAWEEDRRERILGKSRISVKVSDMSIKIEGSKASARFKQAYQADSLSVSSRKTLELAKAGDKWVIVRESTGG
jgi:Tetratricopeptide repeat/TPR repeat